MLYLKKKMNVGNNKNYYKIKDDINLHVLQWLCYIFVTLRGL